MTILTRQDLEDRFGAPELAALDATEDGREVARAITDTEAEIRAELAVNYDLPLASACPQLTAIGCDLARRRLYDEAVTDNVRNSASRSRKQLKRLGAGEIPLIDAAGQVVAQRGREPLGRRTGPEPEMPTLLDGYR